VSGPLTFARFMEQALYDPERGYYSRPRERFGASGDFFTNDQLQPVFGRLVACQIERWRAELGSPAGFTVVELGPGRGQTGDQIRALPGVEYIGLERGAGSLPERFTGVVFSNEFFDALPVHVTRFAWGRWRERYVGPGPEWVDGKLSTPLLEDYLRRYVRRPARGQIAEVNLEALGWLERIAGSLERGYVLTIDYGYTEEEITRGRRFPAGSLMSYRRHLASEEVLSDPGERDLTAHVNFTALVRRGEELGLQAVSLRSQTSFLLSIGEADLFASALAASKEPERRRLWRQLKTLLFGLGETFRVLVQRAGPQPAGRR